MLDLDASAAQLALTREERQRVAAALGREPSQVEWFAFDAQWSEHCSYKSSRAFLRRLPVTGEHVIVGVGEDAGVVRIGSHDGESYGIVIAHESHNHPSQVVPFEGAATGIGGIVRDVLCMGAHLIGPDVTELLPELTLAQMWELTPEEIARNVHSHPTLSEALGETAAGLEGHMIDL